MQPMSRTLAHTIVAFAFMVLLTLACLQVPGEWNWSGVWEYRQKFLQGWLVTLGLSLAALVLSVLIGLVVALLHQRRVTDRKPIRSERRRGRKQSTSCSRRRAVA